LLLLRLLLQDCGVDIFTLGQYLQPTLWQWYVVVTPSYTTLLLLLLLLLQDCCVDIFTLGQYLQPTFWQNRNIMMHLS
jgi:lipoate synthase